MVYIFENYTAIKKDIAHISYQRIDECFTHIHSKQFSVIIDEENLKLIDGKYRLKIVGDLQEIAARLQQLVGKGNRFEKDVLNAKIIDHELPECK